MEQRLVKKARENELENGRGGRKRMEESGRVKPQKRRDTDGTNFRDSFKIAVLPHLSWILNERELFLSGLI